MIEADKQLANLETEEAVVSGVMGEDSGFGSTEDFFLALDQKVNQGVLDSGPEIEAPQEQSEMATQDLTLDSKQDADVKTETDGTDWEKRYKDSSREAQKMRDKLKNVEEFVPVLDLMRDDPGAVQAVRSYLENGQQQNARESLNLPEDFIFDIDEAMTSPKSDSARLFEAVVSNATERRVNKKMSEVKSQQQQLVEDDKRDEDVKSFKDEMNLSDDDVEDLMSWAKEHKITLNDMHLLKNRGKVASNVAQETRKDILDQMKSVRDIPISASSSNSVGPVKKADDAVFDLIADMDKGIEDIFSG